MTPEVCFKFCQNVKGVQYMGLQIGRKCYCSPFFTQGTGNDGGDCDVPCEGDSSVMCGGKARVDMYSLHDCSNIKGSAFLIQERPDPFVKEAVISSKRGPTGSLRIGCVSDA